MPLLSNILNLAGHILRKRVTENLYGQNMISLLDSQLPMMNASQRRAKYAERPSPCQSRAGYLPCSPRDTQLLRALFSFTSTLSSLTPTFLWLYWSVLTTCVCLSRCSIHPSSRRVSSHAQQSRQKTGFRAAATRLLLLRPCGRRSLFFWLQRECGFWSIHNGLHSFAAIECRCVKIYRKGRVM